MAEGNKASAILNAEGSKASAILTAEGERQAAILRAEGFALALKTINDQAITADQKTMSLQYLDTLKQIGGSPSSKIVVPMELSASSPASSLSPTRPWATGGLGRIGPPGTGRPPRRCRQP